MTKLENKVSGHLSIDGIGWPMSELIYTQYDSANFSISTIEGIPLGGGSYASVINGTTGVNFTSIVELNDFISSAAMVASGGGSGGGGGDASASNQTIEIAKLTSIDNKTPALFGGNVPVTVANFPASTEISNDSGNPIPVSATSLPLPTGASTAANQTTGNTSLASIDSKTPVVGQTTMAASSPVVIASNQTSIPVLASPLVRTDTDASSSITTGGAAQLAATGNSAGQIYKLQNLSSEVLWFSLTNTTPSAFGTGCFSLAPYNNGTSGYYESSVPTTNSLYIFGATTGSKFTLLKS